MFTTLTTLLNPTCLMCGLRIRSKLVMLEEFGFRHSRGHGGQVERVLAALTYPDWLILYYLAQCMEKKNFSLLVSKMCEREKMKNIMLLIITFFNNLD